MWNCKREGYEEWHGRICEEEELWNSFWVNNQGV